MLLSSLMVIFSNRLIFGIQSRLCNFGTNSYICLPVEIILFCLHSYSIQTLLDSSKKMAIIEKHVIVVSTGHLYI